MVDHHKHNIIGRQHSSLSGETACSSRNLDPDSQEFGFTERLLQSAQIAVRSTFGQEDSDEARIYWRNLSKQAQDRFLSAASKGLHLDLRTTHEFLVLFISSKLRELLVREAFEPTPEH